MINSRSLDVVQFMITTTTTGQSCVKLPTLPWRGVGSCTYTIIVAIQFDNLYAEELIQDRQNWIKKRKDVIFSLFLSLKRLSFLNVWCCFEEKKFGVDDLGILVTY